MAAIRDSLLLGKTAEAEPPANTASEARTGSIHIGHLITSPGSVFDICHLQLLLYAESGICQ